MNTSEIMRGDLLYYKGRWNAFPFKVEGVIEKKIGYYPLPDNKRMYYLDQEECYPIPLTEEILTRNFLNHKEIVWFPLDTKPGYFNIYWEYPSFGDGEIRLNIQYVHELQHILKLCNINKEIEL